MAASMHLQIESMKRHKSCSANNIRAGQGRAVQIRAEQGRVGLFKVRPSRAV